MTAVAEVIFPTDPTAPALPYYLQPLTEEERADAQRWALELSQLEDPEARQARLAMAPVHWQPTIRHYLAWRLGMAALWATLRKAEPATRVKSLPRGGKLKRVCYVLSGAIGRREGVAGNGRGLDSSRPLMCSTSGGVLRQCRR